MDLRKLSREDDGKMSAWWRENKILAGVIRFCCFVENVKELPNNIAKNQFQVFMESLAFNFPAFNFLAFNLKRLIKLTDQKPSFAT